MANDVPVTISITKYIEDISSIRFNQVDISNSLQEEFPQGNPEFIALANLREFKNREGNRGYTINQNGELYRTREGRETGNNIDFQQVASDGTIMTYEIRKMRRKAEVLQYNRENSSTKRENYRNIVKQKNARKLSRYQLKLLQEASDISNCNVVKSQCNSIIYNRNIPVSQSKDTFIINGGGL